MVVNKNLVFMRDHEIGFYKSCSWRAFLKYDFTPMSSVVIITSCVIT